jgi:hypothetical protein
MTKNQIIMDWKRRGEMRRNLPFHPVGDGIKIRHRYQIPFARL